MDDGQKIYAERLVQSKKYTPHTYMKTDCSIRKLYELCDFSQEKLDEVMSKIVARAISQLDESGIKTMIHFKFSGQAEAIDIETMLPHSLANTEFGVNYQKLFTEKLDQD
jgi:hypothetical protein